jgi:pimeloyl-ACP methyl ester carboxylesterase
VPVPDRGEVFVRYVPGPPGAATVLLLHGWMVSAELNWVGAFSALAGHYHVLAVDHRGHGRGIRTTEPFTLEDCADDAAGLLDTIGVRDAIVAGYSMGGPIALLMARRHPERVKALVLMATAADLGRTGLERGFTQFVRVLGPVFRSGLPDWVLAAAARSQPAVLGDWADLYPWMAGEMKRLHPSDIVASGRAIAEFDARGWLNEIRKPVVSVVTSRDRMVRADKQRATAAALDAPVIELDAGHGVCATAPDTLGAAVRQAVDLVAAAPGPRGRRLARVAERWLRGAPDELPSLAPVNPVNPVTSTMTS